MKHQVYLECPGVLRRLWFAMPRIHHLILITSTLALTWLGMMAVHELGHVLGAWLTGGRIERVVLHPLAFSRTDVTPNPSPGVVVWMGPTVGMALPIVLWLIAQTARLPGHYVLRFFAGFCLIANGAYLGFGTFDRIGDVGEMLELGTPLWLLWLIAATGIPLGLWTWHGLGPHFGIGRDADPIDPRVVWTTLALLLIALLLTII